MKYPLLILASAVILFAGCVTRREIPIDVRLAPDDRSVTPELVYVTTESDRTLIACGLGPCQQYRVGEFITESGRKYPFIFSDGSPHYQLPKAQRYLLMITAHPPEKKPYRERHLLVTPIDGLPDAEPGDAENGGKPLGDEPRP